MKNEIPIGSTICTSGSGDPSPTELSAPSTSETKKPRYLKTHNKPRSKQIAATKARLRVRGEVVVAITRAATVFTTLEAISRRTQRQSTQP